MIKWDRETIFNILPTCNSLADLRKKHPMVRRVAKRLGIMEEVRKFYNVTKKSRYNPHMEKEIHDCALQCKIRSEFKRRFRSQYKAAITLGILDKVCSHMPQNASYRKVSPRRKWTFEKVSEFVKENNIISRSQLEELNASAYNSARNLGFLEELFKGVPILMPRYENIDFIGELAKECSSRSEFEKKHRNEYYIAIRWGRLDEFCSHMERKGDTSLPEEEIFSIISSYFPSAQKLKLRKIKIEGRPYIKGFDIDIYIPELNLGIEFDGAYWHSFKGLRKSKPHWPDEAIINYHVIKDDYFLNQKDIKILHIKEEDWVNNKNKCLKELFKFLGIEHAT